MRLFRGPDQIRRIAIVISAAVAAALVLWRLWPSQPVPPVSLPEPDRADKEAPHTEVGPHN
ncbi:MAG TPA: hypothetical protein VN800_04385 [Candidatus Acidoferrales bacterium]|nr:hypothetical protein [Candidatus Acidoferrales bacterium]